MTSLLAGIDVAGVQRPRVCSVPPYVSTSGSEAVELARLAGLHLDPWQEFVLSRALGERPDGSWSAFEVGLIVSRQNGKGSILEARELAGLFLLGERLIIHSAHQFDTSLEAFRRLLELVESTPDLERRVMKVTRSHGEEGIELTTGQRIRFRTRTSGGGRGFSCDCLILDEAMILPDSVHGALLPTLSARQNPQVWYTGSAVDKVIHEHGRVLARIRERGTQADTPDSALAYFEWSPPVEIDNVDDAVANDPEAWAQANPGLGIRISSEHVAREQASLDPRTFAVERLGVGDWPALDSTAGDVIPIAAWKDVIDTESEIVGPVSFAYDVRPDRSRASIAAAGRREDGRFHVEVLEHRPGTAWVVERLGTLTKSHECGPVVYGQGSPAGALANAAENAGLELHEATTKEHAEGFGLLLDAVEQHTIRHLGTPEMTSALKGAIARPVGDARVWSRKASTVDISPLVACTLALWGAENLAAADRPGIEVWS